MRLQTKPIPGVKIKHKNKEGTIWDIAIQGPKNTPYEGGIFHIESDFSDHYPFKPPKCKFLTKIFHLNVQKETGMICKTIYEDDWKPVSSAKTIISVF